MRHELFWFTVFILFLGLYFDTEVTKEFVQGFLVRTSEILVQLAGK
ncbi:MAG: hypothetical protein VW079_01015 [Candidatus Woesearchaeota archaeon]|jgi:hypothetical protein